MEITAIREAIIGLIEPYMDKTLAIGVIIKKDKGKRTFFGELSVIEEIDNGRDYKGRIIKENIYLFNDYESKEKEIQFVNFEKYILGHYDITAVLQYMWAKKQIKIGNGPYTLVCESHKYYQGEIPNKPLHLYTEEEDKKLLELLLKLN